MILTILITAIVFLIILSLLVFIHEAGHFFVAKWSGIKVEEFGFGLPPRAWGKKVGETIYSLNWLPFGGFVKLYGEDEAGSGAIHRSQDRANDGPEDPNRAFTAKPMMNRIAVVVAGVVMNLVLAIVLYYAYVASQGFTVQVPLLPFLNTPHFIGAQQRTIALPYVTYISPGSPAEQAGMRVGDLFTKLNGTPIENVDQAKAIITQNQGKPVTFTFERDNKTNDVTATPRIDVPAGQGPLGVGFGVEVAELSYQTPTQKALSGISQTYNMATYSFNALGALIGTAITKHDVTPVSEGVAGPVGIAKVVNDILVLGGNKMIPKLIEFMALLSLNLAVVNILPFPALDGGRLWFLLYEAITRRKPNPKFEQYVNTAGMAILLGLIVLITFNDLRKLFMPS